MQEHTTKKAQASPKTRIANGIQIVDTVRNGVTGAEALREAHMNLVRAEQNLYTLIQASPASSAQFSASAGFGYPATHAIQPAFGAPAYVPGFAPTASFPSPAPVGYGMVPGLSAWGTGTPTPISPWTPWTSAIPSAPGSVRGASGIGSRAFAPTAFPVGIAGRALACDIIDEGKQFVCQLELPGVEADQVELLCFENAVAISAYRETEGEIANLVQSERGDAAQQRIIALPNQIQPGGAKATLSNGILTVVLPKVHPTEGPRRVEVQG